VAANHVEATGFLWDGERVSGVRARDRVTNHEFDIRTRLVLNAAGPWADYLLQDEEHFPGHRRGHFSRDACFLVDRKPRSAYALAVPGFSKDSDALVSRAARHLFAVPWRDCTLIGVWHRLFSDRPDSASVAEEEIESWLAEMNASQPAMRLTRSDVIYSNCGLVPFGDGRTAPGELSFGKESRFIDHRAHGVGGLVSLIGIRFTTARGDAARALDLLLQQLPDAPPRAPTEQAPLAGGNISDFAALEADARREVAPEISTRTLHAWLRNHGTDYRALADLARTPAQAVQLGAAGTVMAEVTHAVQTEMAVHLDDVVLRRTNLGSGSHPGEPALIAAAQAMQSLLGWTNQQRDEQVAATSMVLRGHRAAVPRPLQESS
jgi:glycerol-3-phosphate dehydrogenase